MKRSVSVVEEHPLADHAECREADEDEHRQHRPPGKRDQDPGDPRRNGDECRRHLPRQAAQQLPGLRRGIDVGVNPHSGDPAHRRDVEILLHHGAGSGVH